MNDCMHPLPGIPAQETNVQFLERLDSLPIADGYHAVWCIVRQFAEERKLAPSELMTIFNVGQVAAAQLWPAERLAPKGETAA